MFLRFFVLLLLALQTATALQLTLEEKVGQLMMVHFNGTEANADAKRLIDEARVGGFIYYEWANSLDSPEQVRNLSASLQALSNKAPLLIAVDQEGGRILRLKKNFSKPPPNSWLGSQGRPKLAERWAETVGKELKSVGINMNLAPVVDVASTGRSIIGDRSYSFEPWEVVRFGQAALKGYRRAGIIAVLKHFPGHGDASADSHIALPVVAKERSRLDKVELLPYRRLLHEAPAVMTAHLMVPAIDGEKCSSLSSKTIEGLLRTEYGYQGLVMTDSLVMQGVLEKVSSIEEAAIQAIEAGNDLIILGGKLLQGEAEGRELKVDEVIAIHRALVEAVKSGRLSMQRIDASSQRILRIKESI